MDWVSHGVRAPQARRFGPVFSAIVLLLTALIGPSPALAADDDEEGLVESALSGSVIAVRDPAGAVAAVHYLGVEAPAQGQPYHEEARLANAALVEGRRVVLRRSASDRLADGARVRHVFLLEGAADQELGDPVAARLLAEGHAWRVTDAANEIDGGYQELEGRARLAGLGVWSRYAPTPYPDYFGALPARRDGDQAPAGVATSARVAPAPFGIPWFGVRVDRRLDAVMGVVDELGERWAWVFPTLRDNGVQVVLEPLPPWVGGFFAPDANLVGINASLDESDPQAVATAVIHEASHVRDYFAGEPMRTLEGCFQTEIRAYHTQAEAWLRLYGPDGKQPAADDFEQGLNDLLQAYREDRARIELTVRQRYARQCARIAVP